MNKRQKLHRPIIARRSAVTRRLLAAVLALLTFTQQLPLVPARNFAPATPIHSEPSIKVTELEPPPPVETITTQTSNFGVELTRKFPGGPPLSYFYYAILLTHIVYVVSGDQLQPKLLCPGDQGLVDRDQLGDGVFLQLDSEVPD